MIEARGLTKRYGPKTAVDGISFTVRPGTVVRMLQSSEGESNTPRVLNSAARLLDSVAARPKAHRA